VKAAETTAGFSLRPEYELLLLCCTGCGISERSRIEAVLHISLDWERVAESAVWHGVMPLVHRALTGASAARVLADELGQLRLAFNANLLHNQHLTRELVRLTALLESVGIGALAYKGPALAIAAYGNVAMRQFTDLDVVVRKADFGRTAEILRSQGYTQRSDPRAFESGLFRESASNFSCGRGIIHIDLHWELSPRYFNFAPETDAVFERASRISLEGGSILVPALEDLIIALCVHASRDAWAQLSMVSDIAALIEANPTLDWSATMERAGRVRARRMVLLGFYLAHELLAARIADQIVAMAQADAYVVSLARTIQRRLFTRHADRKRKFPALVVPLRSIERRGDRLRFLSGRVLLPSADDSGFLRLPRLLLPLHYFVRPLHLVCRYGLRLIRRLAASAIERTPVNRTVP
jgi:Uncharacterised nucleotidyltransferase